MTTREQLIEALVYLGLGVVTQGDPRSEFQRQRPYSTKYIVLRRPIYGGYYFVGRNGALRVGKTVSDSVSLSGTGRYHSILALAADRKAKGLPAMQPGPMV